MKKLFMFIMAITMAVALSACGNKGNEDASVTPEGDAAGQEVAVEEDTGVFTSIKDALNKSIPIKCIYTDEDGLSMAMYLKGNIMRADSIKQSETDVLISEIMKDNKIYVWTEDSTQGMIIDLSAMQPDDDSMKIGETAVHSTDDIIAELDRQKQNCAREVVSDSIFEIPTNITFMELK